ncbi:hypothetical protein [Nocardia jejuensis]|uniref:hypothetical protein n=1 Tax=Nocardia jejuensis TaxID=328049 RepID=UPI0008363309|nr:hypothetical protein [Nocardia jejuensis]
MGHPLAYPVIVTIGALAICVAWAPFCDSEQVGMVGAVVLVVLGYSGFRGAVAFGVVSAGSADASAGAVGKGARSVAVRRVRQQHRLVSRSWLEFGVGGRNRWLPVYFDPALVGLTQASAELSGRGVYIGEQRVYPSGRVRATEPAGRLIDNPSRPDAQAAATAAHVASFGRRLLLDAQSAIAGPFAGLLWVYVAGGGPMAFAGATTIGAAVATWLAAVRGSDPS